MRLGVIFLQNYSGHNSFTEVEEITLTEGNATRIYFRLVDLDQEGKCSAPRYIPLNATPPTLSALLNHIDADKVINRVATMAAPNDDRSIWYIDITATDKVAGGQFQITLTEGSLIRKAVLSQGIAIDSPDDGRHFC